MPSLRGSLSRLAGYEYDARLDRLIELAIALYLPDRRSGLLSPDLRYRIPCAPRPEAQLRNDVLFLAACDHAARETGAPAKGLSAWLDQALILGSDRPIPEYGELGALISDLLAHPPSCIRTIPGENPPLTDIQIEHALELLAERMRRQLGDPGLRRRGSIYPACTAAMSRLARMQHATARPAKDVVDALLDDPGPSVLVGAGGSGKTHIMMQATLDLIARARNEPSSLVVYVDLRALSPEATTPADISQAIAEQFAATTGVSPSQRQIDELWGAGRLSLVLDGADAVSDPQQRAALRRLILGVPTTRSAARVIVAGRLDSVRHLGPSVEDHLRRIELERLGDRARRRLFRYLLRASDRAIRSGWRVRMLRLSTWFEAYRLDRSYPAPGPLDPAADTLDTPLRARLVAVALLHRTRHDSQRLGTRRASLLDAYVTTDDPGRVELPDRQERAYARVHARSQGEWSPPVAPEDDPLLEHDVVQSFLAAGHLLRVWDPAHDDVRALIHQPPWQRVLWHVVADARGVTVLRTLLEALSSSIEALTAAPPDGEPLVDRLDARLRAERAIEIAARAVHEVRTEVREPEPGIISTLAEQVIQMAEHPVATTRVRMLNAAESISEACFETVARHAKSTSIEWVERRVLIARAASRFRPAAQQYAAELSRRMAIGRLDVRATCRVLLAGGSKAPVRRAAGRALLSAALNHGLHAALLAFAMCAAVIEPLAAWARPLPLPWVLSAGWLGLVAVRLLARGAVAWTVPTLVAAGVGSVLWSALGSHQDLWHGVGATLSIGLGIVWAGLLAGQLLQTASVWVCVPREARGRALSTSWHRARGSALLTAWTPLVMGVAMVVWLAERFAEDTEPATHEADWPALEIIIGLLVARWAWGRRAAIRAYVVGRLRGTGRITRSPGLPAALATVGVYALIAGCIIQLLALLPPPEWTSGRTPAISGAGFTESVSTARYVLGLILGAVGVLMLGALLGSIGLGWGRTAVETSRRPGRRRYTKEDVAIVAILMVVLGWPLLLDASLEARITVALAGMSIGALCLSARSHSVWPLVGLAAGLVTLIGMRALFDYSPMIGVLVLLGPPVLVPGALALYTHRAALRARLSRMHSRDLPRLFAALTRGMGTGVAMADGFARAVIGVAGAGGIALLTVGAFTLAFVVALAMIDWLYAAGSTPSSARWVTTVTIVVAALVLHRVWSAWRERLAASVEPPDFDEWTRDVDFGDLMATLVRLLALEPAAEDQSLYYDRVAALERRLIDAPDGHMPHVPRSMP